jgi:hypothetical protein
VSVDVRQRPWPLAPLLAPFLAPRRQATHSGSDIECIRPEPPESSPVGTHPSLPDLGGSQVRPRSWLSGCEYHSVPKWTGRTEERSIGLKQSVGLVS